MGEEFPWTEAIDRLEGAYAPKSLREYRQYVAEFVAWCHASGREPLPATSHVVAAYVRQALDIYKYRTVKHRLTALRAVHRVMQVPHEIDSAPVHVELRRALRDPRHKPRQAKGLTAELRNRLIAACPPDLQGLRDRVLISVGYDTLCRRSELCSIHLEDIRRLPNGTARVLISRSKTDQAGVGWYAFVSRVGMQHVDRWLDAARITGGPLLRPTYRTSIGNHALHPRAVGRVIRERARNAGCPEAVVMRLSGHSLRVGAAQDLAAAGKSILQIMRAGRWTRVAAVEHYVRKAEVNVWAATP